MPFNTPPLPSDLPTNRELINKIDNDITILRGEVMELRELIKLLLRQKEETSGWLFSK
tara:strand:+ start:3100 stop:3273 length:174 start_codon:yes stop_codon:yes gene_type:complete